jgi:hypothetical protein
MTTIEQALGHWDQIRARHPDALRITKSDDFQGWLERQTPAAKRAAVEGTAADIIALLDRYKAACLTPRKPRFTREQIKRMPLAEFERREKEIDAAMRDGRIG